MAITRKNKIARRYNEQLEAAKEAYKAKRGLKVARGFFDTKEAKRIERNKRQAIYRYERKQDKQEAKKALGAVAEELADTTKTIKDEVFTGEAPGIGPFTATIIIANEIFFTALSGNQDVYNAVFDMRERQLNDENAIGIIRYFDERIKTYTSDFQFERGIDRLLKDAEDLQQTKVTINGKEVENRTGSRNKGGSQTILYPMISYVVLETKKMAYLVIIGSFDEAELIALAAETVINS